MINNDTQEITLEDILDYIEKMPAKGNQYTILPDEQGVYIEPKIYYPKSL